MRIIVGVLLRHRNMTQKELSRRTGIEYTRISHALNGRLTFYMDETDPIAEALGVDCATLIGEPDVVSRMMTRDSVDASQSIS